MTPNTPGSDRNLIGMRTVTLTAGELIYKGGWATDREGLSSNAITPSRLHATMVTTETDPNETASQTAVGKAAADMGPTVGSDRYTPDEVYDNSLIEMVKEMG